MPVPQPYVEAVEMLLDVPYCVFVRRWLCDKGPEDAQHAPEYYRVVIWSGGHRGPKTIAGVFLMLVCDHETFWMPFVFTNSSI